jgi:hypothetical protein
MTPSYFHPKVQQAMTHLPRANMPALVWPKHVLWSPWDLMFTLFKVEFQKTVPQKKYDPSYVH